MSNRKRFIRKQMKDPLFGEMLYRDIMGFFARRYKVKRKEAKNG